MLSKKNIFYLIALASVLSFAALTGCDKIPFLSSSKQNSDPKATAPVTVEKKTDVTASSSTGPLAANVIARVGTWSLTTEEFKERLDNLREVLNNVPAEQAADLDVTTPKTKKLVLDELINQQLLVQDAQDRGLDKKKDVSDAIEEFKRTILVREVATKVAEGVQVADAEVADFYNQNKNQFFTSPPDWHIREIMVPTQEEAKEIQIEILKGADFATTATAKSKSPSAAQGGDLGMIKEFPFEQMMAAAMPLEAGQTSSVFKGPDGYYIIKLEEKKGGEAAKLEEVSADIKNYLILNKQQQKIASYIQDLRKRMNVQTNEALIEK